MNYFQLIPKLVKVVEDLKDASGDPAVQQVIRDLEAIIEETKSSVPSTQPPTSPAAA